MAQETDSYSETKLKVIPGFASFDDEQGPTRAIASTITTHTTIVPDISKLVAQSERDDLRSSAYGTVAVGLALYGIRELFGAVRHKDLGRGIKSLVALKASDLFLGRMQELYRLSRSSIDLRERATIALQNPNHTTEYYDSYAIDRLKSEL